MAIGWIVSLRDLQTIHVAAPLLPYAVQVMDVVDSMAEGLEKKPADLLDAMGVETDEEAKVKLADFT
jgi:hypothetical protein